MNRNTYSGRICSVPKISTIQLEGKRIRVCKFVIAVFDGVFEYLDKTDFSEGKVDFFECVAFEEPAKMIFDNFVKGSKIIVSGKMKNHRFSDVNNAKHYTNILLVEQAELGDTEAMLSKISAKKSTTEHTIVSNLKELDELFLSVCKNGFLCIEEDDYYNIAIMNM